jgi:hypothetical protein
LHNNKIDKVCVFLWAKQLIFEGTKLKMDEVDEVFILWGAMYTAHHKR